MYEGMLWSGNIPNKDMLGMELTCQLDVCRQALFEDMNSEVDVIAGDG